MKRSCCFKDPFTREQVDPRVQALWESTYGKKAPFGNLRQMWVREHCRTVAPYDDCPYDKQDCALSFLGAVEQVTGAAKREHPTGYFRSVARTLGYRRAEDKPLARLGLTGTANEGALPGPGLRSTKTGPIAIGDVLKSLDLGPRERPAKDGQASAKR